MKFQTKIQTSLMAVAMVVSAMPATAQQEPAPVFIVAGQSNSDGRVPDVDVPYYANFDLCNYCYGDGRTFRNGEFATYTPYTLVSGDSKRFGYDAFLYHYIGQATGHPFYVIKETLGGTAIDPSCSNSNSGLFWSCDPQWYASQKPASQGGKSLMKSFERSFQACLDNTLNSLEQGYDVKAIFWHQGESDHSYNGPANYYTNLTTLIAHIRSFIAEATGNDSYRQLPFILGTVAHISKQYNPDVEAAHFRIAREDANVHLIDMSEQTLQKDLLHFDATSAEYLAVSAFRKLVELDIVPDTPTWLDKECTNLLANPDFELNRAGEKNPAGTVDRGIPFGWEAVGTLSGNSYGVNSDGVNIHGDNLCWINSTPMPEFFELSQTVPAEKIEPGVYEVRCKLWVEVDRKANCRLFANDNVQYYGYETDYTNLLTDGETADYAGYAGGQNNNFILRNMHVTVDVHEGESLKLGIRSSCRRNTGTMATNNTGWFKVDEFRLFRIGDLTGSGVDAAAATAPAILNHNGVYDLSGRKLRSCADTTGLTTGIYIVDGAKTVVR